MLTFFLARWFLLLWWWRGHIPPKHRFLQDPQGVKSQKTAFFIITAVKTSNLTLCREGLNINELSSILDIIRCYSIANLQCLRRFQGENVALWMQCSRTPLNLCPFDLHWPSFKCAGLAITTQFTWSVEYFFLWSLSVALQTLCSWGSPQCSHDLT
jgi:hypothetical protein